MTLKDKNIALCVAGGIAAYKAIELARMLRKEGAMVFPLMTRAACEFITPLSLSTLAGNPARTGLFEGEERMPHIELARKADLVVIAPATANIIGKMACGIADDLVSTFVMAAGSPVLIAPAMNSRMYENPMVQANIERLGKAGYRFVGPCQGELACGDEGMGRLACLEEILDAIKDALAKKDLSGKRVLVTAGPTREHIDPVRFISNASSGRMGYALARAARRRGAEVVLISGPTELPPPAGVDMVKVTTANEMCLSAAKHLKRATIVCMAAAVTDFRPRESHAGKIKKEKLPSRMEIEMNEDILKKLHQGKGKRLMVGFALETGDMIENARGKMKDKGLDIIVANMTESLGGDETRVSIMDRDGGLLDTGRVSKEEAADRILDRVAALIGR